MGDVFGDTYSKYSRSTCRSPVTYVTTSCGATCCQGQRCRRNESDYGSSCCVRPRPGRRPARHRRESELLQLQEPAAVLVYRFTVYADDDAPIQTDEATYPPDQWAFSQEYPLAR